MGIYIEYFMDYFEINCYPYNIAFTVQQCALYHHLFWHSFMTFRTDLILF